MHPPTATSGGAASAEDFRLPRTVEPETYRMEIEPKVASASFSGTLSIDVLVHETITEMVLNAAELAVSDVEVVTPGGGTLPCTVSFDDELEQVTFGLPSPLPPGRCTVGCRFSGTLNDKLRGFYRSTYTDRDGEPQLIATTQFESVDARRAFPCWDEPDRKAVFEVTLLVDPDVEAYSDPPVISTEIVRDRQRRCALRPP